MQFKQFNAKNAVKKIQILNASNHCRNMLGLNFGICIPKSCTPEKVSKLFATIQRRIFKNKAVLAIVPDTCQVPEDQQWNFDIADWITLLVSTKNCLNFQ